MKAQPTFLEDFESRFGIESIDKTIASMGLHAQGEANYLKSDESVPYDAKLMFALYELLYYDCLQEKHKHVNATMTKEKVEQFILDHWRLKDAPQVPLPYSRGAEWGDKLVLMASRLEVNDSI